MKLILFSLLAAIAFAGCYDCGPQQELTFELDIYSNDSTAVLKNLFSKIGNDTIDLSDKIIESDQSIFSSSLTLPLSLRENQTTYFFEFENRTDSLTLFYERKFYHENRCGFVNDISTTKNPPYAIGTFSNIHIQSTPYAGGEDANGFLKSYTGGIWVNARL